MESTSGQTRSPNHVRSSPTLAITVRLPDGTVSLMAGMSRAPPKPPLRTATRGNVGSLLGVCGTALSTRMAAGFIYRLDSSPSRSYGSSVSHEDQLTAYYSRPSMDRH